MAGAFIAVEFDDRRTLQALNRLVEAGEDLEPLFRDIGEYLLIGNDERWGRQEAPDGTPWAPLSSRYQRHKKKNVDKLLVLDGHLRHLLRYQTSTDALEFGTDRIYGAIHQFGAEERNIAKRPFLGLSDDDEAEILEIVQDYLDASF